MKKTMIALLALGLALGLTACSGGGSVSYKDGTYEGKSEIYENEDAESEEGNGYGVVNITIKDGAIAEVDFKTYELDGTLKDENYGKEGGGVANRDYYNKAQKALAACDEYAEQLRQSGSLKDIDAISGATINFNEFQEAVTAALKQAQQ